MKTILKPFALCAAISMPTNLLAEELTADDYPDPRAATMSEVQEHCNAEDNPDKEARLLSVDPDNEEYPFEIIFCEPAHVSEYKCPTLYNLVNFEFEVRSLFRESGNPLPEDDKDVSQFTDLYEAYDEHCRPLVS